MRKKIEAFLKIMRPSQWFKSFYIIFGAVPAILLMPIEPLLIIYLLFFGITNMILIQGVSYVINDLSDIASDRKHPVKKFRPIAKGDVRKHEAIFFVIFLLIVAFFIAAMIDIRIFYIDVALLLINFAYSFKSIRLKDRKYFDIFSIALNFPLRVMVGWFLFEPYNEARLSLSYAINALKIDSNSIQYILFKLSPHIFNLSLSMSSVTLSFISIMLFTYFLACFLLSEKRKAEKLSLSRAETFRKSLKYYSLTSLKVISLLSAIIVVLSFILIVLSFKVAFTFLTPILIYSIVWYYNLAFTKNSPVMYPERIVTKNKRFMVLVAITVVLTILLIFI